MRGDRAEQVGLVGERAKVSDAVAAVDQHRREVAKHPAGIVRRLAAMQAPEPPRETVHQTEPSRELG